MKVTKKSTTVNAYQFDSDEAAREIITIINAAGGVARVYEEDEDPHVPRALIIESPTGSLLAKFGDWVIVDTHRPVVDAYVVEEDRFWDLYVREEEA